MARLKSSVSFFVSTSSAAVAGSASEDRPARTSEKIAARRDDADLSGNSSNNDSGISLRCGNALRAPMPPHFVAATYAPRRIALATLKSSEHADIASVPMNASPAPVVSTTWLSVKRFAGVNTTFALKRRSPLASRITKDSVSTLGPGVSSSPRRAAFSNLDTTSSNAVPSPTSGVSTPSRTKATAPRAPSVVTITFAFGKHANISVIASPSVFVSVNLSSG